MLRVRHAKRFGLCGRFSSRTVSPFSATAAAHEPRINGVRHKQPEIRPRPAGRDPVTEYFGAEAGGRDEATTFDFAVAPEVLASALTG